MRHKANPYTYVEGQGCPREAIENFAKRVLGACLRGDLDPSKLKGIVYIVRECPCPKCIARQGGSA